MKQHPHPFAVTQEDGATFVNQVGLALVVLPAPALLHWAGSLGGSWILALALCALSGALGGLLFGLGRAPARAGLLGGTLACLGGAVFSYLCLARQERYFLGEAVLLWALGCVPGVLAYKGMVESAPSAPRR